MKNDSSLSVVIVTFNNEQTIARCLDSVLHFYSKAQIIIVDNNSADKTLQVLKKYGNKISLIESVENVGFAKANNKAAQLAQEEYLLFLNPDCKIENDVLSESLAFLKDEKIGIVAPQLILENGKPQKSVRKISSLMGVIKEYYLGYKNEYSEYFPEGDQPVEVECVYGAAMLMRKDFFKKLGGFAEKYFLYYEDIDLCQRVKEHNKKIIYLPKAKIKHTVGTSGVKSSKPQNLFSHFIPLKSSGSYYYQVLGRYIFHGLLTGFLISLLLFLSVKLNVQSKN